MNEIMSNSSSCETEVRSGQKLSHKSGSAIMVVNDCLFCGIEELLLID